MWLVIILPYSLLLVLSKGVNGEGHPNLSLLPAKCGFIDGERVSDSKYARLYEFPWMADIFNFGQDGGRQSVCSGTVIHQRYILTVGHCAKRFNKLRINQVRVGDYDSQHDVDCEGQGPELLCEYQFQEIDIEEVIVHENFNSTLLQNDIALLRLKTPIDFSHKNAAPVCLPFTAELQMKTLPEQQAIIAGWELMVNGVTNSKMLKINIPIKELDECTTDLSGNFTSDKPPVICTGGEDGVCPMLSGSPLMLPCVIKEDGYRYVQYGITSFGSPGCNSKQWTLYTDVSKYMDWILDNLKA